MIYVTVIHNWIIIFSEVNIDNGITPCSPRLTSLLSISHPMHIAIAYKNEWYIYCPNFVNLKKSTPEVANAC